MTVEKDKNFFGTRTQKVWNVHRKTSVAHAVDISRDLTSKSKGFRTPRSQKNSDTSNWANLPTSAGLPKIGNIHICVQGPKTQFGGLFSQHLKITQNINVWKCENNNPKRLTKNFLKVSELREMV